MSSAGRRRRVGPFNNPVPLRSARSERKCVLAASLIWPNEKTAEAHRRVLALAVTHSVTFSHFDEELGLCCQHVCSKYSTRYQQRLSDSARANVGCLSRLQNTSEEAPFTFAHHSGDTVEAKVYAWFLLEACGERSTRRCLPTHTHTVQPVLI